MNKEYKYSFYEAVTLLDAASVMLFGRALFDFLGRKTISDPADAERAVKDLFGASRGNSYRAYQESPDWVYTLREMLFCDAESIFARDPAADSVEEVVYCYPGFYAIFCHRISHALREYGVALLPRLISEYAHSLTGIDIHPGAEIGRGFAIDHGTGIVIGETASIGENVTVYHGVTLGTKSIASPDSVEKLKGQKRHPTVERNCVICAGAQILGKDTVIGEGSVIGAGARVTSSVLPNTVIRCKSDRH